MTIRQFLNAYVKLLKKKKDGGWKVKKFRSGTIRLCPPQNMAPERRTHYDVYFCDCPISAVCRQRVFDEGGNAVEVPGGDYDEGAGKLELARADVPIILAAADFSLATYRNRDVDPDDERTIISRVRMLRIAALPADKMTAKNFPRKIQKVLAA